MWLISAQTTVGTGYTKLEGASSFAQYQSDKGFSLLGISGTPTSSAGVSLLCSPDPDYGGWTVVTSWTTTGAATATAQFSSLYPYICARVDYISAGPALINFQYVGRKQQF